MGILDCGLRILDFGFWREQGKEMKREEMNKRTKEFAKEIVKLCRKLPDNREGREEELDIED